MCEGVQTIKRNAVKMYIIQRGMTLRLTEIVIVILSIPTQMGPFSTSRS